MSQVTTIDLGSNSFRVLMYDYEKHETINEYNEIVGTADGLVDSGLISNDAIQRVIDAITKSSNELNYNPSDTVCVTTAAMRMAKNSAEVLEKIYNKTGVRLNIIEGKEEARLTRLAIKYALKRENILSNNFIILDIGGGSTELIVNQANEYFAKSFDFGIVTLCQKHSDTQKLIVDLENRKNEINQYLTDLNINLDDFEFVATAGTPTTIAAIKHGQNFLNYDKNAVNGTIVEFNDLLNCLNMLNNNSTGEVENLIGKNRKEVIEVGILIYKCIYEVLDKKESIVLDDGLREGVAINHGIKSMKA